MLNFNQWYNRQTFDQLSPQVNPEFGGEGGNFDVPQYLQSKYSGANDPAFRNYLANELARMTGAANNSGRYTGNDPNSYINAYRQKGMINDTDQNANGGWMFNNPLSKSLENLGDSRLVQQGFPALVMYMLGQGAAGAAGGAAAEGGGAYGAETAGGGEVGSGYASSAPGPGDGMFGGGAGSDTLTGDPGADTIGASTTGSGFNPYGSQPLAGPASTVGPYGPQSAVPNAVPGTGYSTPSFTSSAVGDPLTAGSAGADLGAAATTGGGSPYGQEYGVDVSADTSPQATTNAGLGVDPSVSSGGAMDMAGSNSYPGAGTSETIFGGNSASPGGYPTSIWDKVNGVMGGGNTAATVRNGLGIAGGLMGLSNSNRMSGATRQLGAQTSPNMYNYRMNDDMVNKYLRDPMSILSNNPGYQASVDYLTKEGKRKMAQQGYNDSGNTNYYMADTLGKNADKWFTDAWQPIRDAAGVTNYPNMGAMDQVKLNAQKQVMDSKNQAYGSLFKAGSDLLPNIFKYALG